MSEPVIGLVLDCRDPDALATFWAAALDYVHLGTADNHAMLIPDDRPGPKLLLQRVPELKAAKNRMHLDIETADIDGCASRLEALGAIRTQEAEHHELGHKWIVMADPEGNEFCVCDGGGASA